MKSRNQRVFSATTLAILSLFTIAGAGEAFAAPGPCAKLSQDPSMSASSSWGMNTVPGTTRYIAQCVDQRDLYLSACIAIGQPKDPSLGSGGLDVVIRVYGEQGQMVWTNQRFFFTDTAKVMNGPGYLRAEDVSVKGPQDPGTRLGDTSGYKSYLQMDWGYTEARFTEYYTANSAQLPYLVNWELKQDELFHCKPVPQTTRP